LVDNKPFEDVNEIIRQMNVSEKVFVFAEWNKEMFKPKQNGKWQKQYHAHLWKATDFAIQACHPKTEWLVVSNGDNIYGKNFVHSVLRESASRTDLIAFDFYSRFNRPTMPPCYRFAPSYNHLNNCKENFLRWCQTDLGSVAFRYKRFVKEERQFARVDSYLELSNNDGLLIEMLVRDGWRFTNDSGTCLFTHSPTIQMCAAKGKVWDDTEIYTGGDCISSSVAAAKLQSDLHLEMVELSVIHASNFEEEYPGNKAQKLSRAKCIRRKDYDSVEQVAILQKAYGERCTHPHDMDSFRSMILSSRTKSKHNN
jgi:hypothetical protein